MKKIFLITVVLMLTTPAWAVTINVWSEPNAVGDANEVQIWYSVTPPPADCEDGNRPRAFGLNVTVSDGNIIGIEHYFEGECDDVNKGFGIFPGTISIDGGDVSDFGSPVAPDDDPGAENTGIDTNTVVLEMGSLYVDANCPPTPAMLCTLIVSLDCDVNITGNAARTGSFSPTGVGVVLENLLPLAAQDVVFTGHPVFGTSQIVPNVVGMIQADACDAIEDANCVVGDITWECNSTYGYDYVIGQFPAGGAEVPHGTEVALVKSLGECDWGDANDPTYPTLKASNGAMHTIGGGLLGAIVDAELDGQPNATATGDDIAGSDDEDGVVISGGTNLVAKGAINSAAVTASVAGYLNAWLDKNADGDWADDGEQIFTDQALAAGLNNLTFTVDCDANSGPTVSRWRYTTYDTLGTLSYVGLALDGEVEDHLVEIVCHVPDVVDMTMADANAVLEAACFNVGVITYECSDTIADGNVISTDPAYCNYPECGTDVNMVVSNGIPCGYPYPPCWDWTQQCNGDTVGDDQQVILADFFVFKDAFGKNYWDHYPVDDQNIQPGEYHPCADYDRNGFVELADFFVFKDSFQVTDVSGYPVCPPGDGAHEVYKPGSVKP